MSLNKSLIKLCSTILLIMAMAPAVVASYSFTPDDGDPISISSQLIGFLEGIDLSELTEEKKVFVDIMINAKGEILVLSTNDETFDSLIKSKLNYKKLTNHFLEIDKTYTIPVLFNGKSKYD